MEGCPGILEESEDAVLPHGVGRCRSSWGKGECLSGNTAEFAGLTFKDTFAIFNFERKNLNYLQKDFKEVI